MTGQQLKNTILQEAIEGRLVPQDPNDEPASVLLERIRTEKERLVKEKKIKKDKNESRIYRTDDGHWMEHFEDKNREDVCIDEEIPFELPSGWEWCRLGLLVNTTTGKTPARGEAKYWSDSIYPWVSISDMKQGEYIYKTKEYISEVAAKECFSNKMALTGTLIMSFKLTVGRTSILGVNSYHNEAIISIETLCDGKKYTRDYLLYVLPIISNSGDSKNAIKGKTLNSTSIYNLLIPLPPLTEQHRIVEKIESLLPKVEAYGKAQEELVKLTEALPEQLKKSILQEAIEGRLVPQDPNDEPASVLLERIRAEKAQLVKEKKIKKDKNESRIYRTEDGHWMEHFEDKSREDICIDEEIPFELPNGWEWCRLGDTTYNHGQKKPDKEFSYIDIGSIDNKLQRLNEKENILQVKEAPSRARKIVCHGDILYATVRPYLHNMCIVDKNFVREPIASTGFAVLCCLNELYNKYLFYYLLSPIFDSYANDGDNAKGMAYPAINDEKLYKGLVPLPPLAEQHRIVEKLEEILPKLNELKKETDN